jgi:hypothetical protein
MTVFLGSRLPGALTTASCPSWVLSTGGPWVRKDQYGPKVAFRVIITVTIGTAAFALVLVVCIYCCIDSAQFPARVEGGGGGELLRPLC